MARLIKAATTPGTSYDGTWISAEFNVEGRSKVGVMLDIVKGSATTVTLKFQALNDGTWYDVYRVTSGAGVLDELALTVTADDNRVVPVSVEPYQILRISLKVDNATSCTVAARLVDTYVQPVTNGYYQDAGQ